METTIEQNVVLTKEARVRAAQLQHAINSIPTREQTKTYTGDLITIGKIKKYFIKIFYF